MPRSRAPASLSLRRLQLTSLRDGYPDLVSTDMLQAWASEAYDGSLVDDFNACMERRKRRVTGRGAPRAARSGSAGSTCRRESCDDDSGHSGAFVGGCGSCGSAGSGSDSCGDGGCSDSFGGCSDSW